MTAEPVDHDAVVAVVMACAEEYKDSVRLRHDGRERLQRAVEWAMARARAQEHRLAEGELHYCPLQRLEADAAEKWEAMQ